MSLARAIDIGAVLMRESSEVPPHDGTIGLYTIAATLIAGPTLCAQTTERPASDVHPTFFESATEEGKVYGRLKQGCVGIAQSV